jgi:hypothetical protein
MQDLYASSRLKCKPACFFMWEVIVRKAIGVVNYLAREAVISFFHFFFKNSFSFLPTPVSDTMAGFSAFHSATLCAQNDAYNPMLPAGSNQFNASRSCASARDPHTRTQQPIVTGTAVLGLKYKDGVMLAADTLGNSEILWRYLWFHSRGNTRLILFSLRIVRQSCSLQRRTAH